LDDLPKVGWVNAGKLMAAKRPRLIPVFDSGVKRALKPPSGRFWVTMYDQLSDDEGRRQKIAEVCSTAPAEVSRCAGSMSRCGCARHEADPAIPKPVSTPPTEHCEREGSGHRSSCCGDGKPGLTPRVGGVVAMTISPDGVSWSCSNCVTIFSRTT